MYVQCVTYVISFNPDLTCCHASFMETQRAKWSPIFIGFYVVKQKVNQDLIISNSILKNCYLGRCLVERSGQWPFISNCTESVFSVNSYHHLTAIKIG